MIVEVLTVGPFQENCYVVGDEETMAGAIIDPGEEAARIALKLAIEGYRRLGKASAHDALVARHLAEILTGGDTDPTRAVSTR